MSPTAVPWLIGGGLVVSFIVGGALLYFVADRVLAAPAAADPIVADEPTAPPPPEFREIDLPETRRQEVYRELAAARGTTTDAKMPLTKDSAIGKHVRKTLFGVFERELKQQALINNVTTDDLREVLKEGDAKGW